MVKSSKTAKKSMSKRRSVFKRRVVSKSRQPTKAFTKLVQAVISRNIENKSRQCAYEMAVQATQPGGAEPWFGLIPISPYYDPGAPIGSIIDIDQGVGQGQRVGNTIRTKYCQFKGVMYPRPESPETNPNPVPMEVCMWIFKIKDQKDGTALAPNAKYFVDNEFFQSNNSTEGVVGSIINMVQTINSDNIHLYYKRVFKVGYSQGTGTSGQPNNDFAFNRKFSINITKFLPKVIKYDDNNENPSINPVYCFIAPFRADGSVDLGNNKPLQVDYEINYVYEDA